MCVFCMCHYYSSQHLRWSENNKKPKTNPQSLLFQKSAPEADIGFSTILLSFPLLFSFSIRKSFALLDLQDQGIPLWILSRIFSVFFCTATNCLNETGTHVTDATHQKPGQVKFIYLPKSSIKVCLKGFIICRLQHITSNKIKPQLRPDGFATDVHRLDRCCKNDKILDRL